MVSAPTESDSVRTRILRGAAEVFGTKGYGPSSVEDILAESGVSRRTFYKTFRGKQAVLQVLFDNSVTMLVSAVREAERTPCSGRERRERAVEAYIRVQAKAGPLARVLLLEQFSPGSPVARARDEAMQTFAELITTGLSAEQEPLPDPILVWGVVAGINQIAVQMATEHPGGDWDVERAKRAMLRVLSALDPDASERSRRAPGSPA